MLDGLMRVGDSHVTLVFVRVDRRAFCHCLCHKPPQWVLHGVRNLFGGHLIGLPVLGSDNDGFAN